MAYCHLSYILLSANSNHQGWVHVPLLERLLSAKAYSLLPLVNVIHTWRTAFHSIALLEKLQHMKKNTLEAKFCHYANK